MIRAPSLVLGRTQGGRAVIVTIRSREQTHFLPGPGLQGGIAVQLLQSQSLALAGGDVNVQGARHEKQGVEGIKSNPQCIPAQCLG